MIQREGNYYNLDVQGANDCLSLYPPTLHKVCIVNTERDRPRGPQLDFLSLSISAQSFVILYRVGNAPLRALCTVTI